MKFLKKPFEHPEAGSAEIEKPGSTAAKSGGSATLVLVLRTKNLNKL